MELVIRTERGERRAQEQKEWEKDDELWEHEKNQRKGNIKKWKNSEVERQEG